MHDEVTETSAHGPDPTPGSGAEVSHAQQRRDDARLREGLTRGQALNESVTAQHLIDAFVTQAVARQIPTEPLRARLLDGHEVRTDKVGWYLRQDRSVAVGQDGSYYVLTVPGGWGERLRGVRLQPTAPPLVIGRGGRDGDSGDLSFFLAKRLDQG